MGIILCFDLSQKFAKLSFCFSYNQCIKQTINGVKEYYCFQLLRSAKKTNKKIDEQKIHFLQYYDLHKTDDTKFWPASTNQSIRQYTGRRIHQSCQCTDHDRSQPEHSHRCLCGTSRRWDLRRIDRRSLRPCYDTCCHTDTQLGYRRTHQHHLCKIYLQATDQMCVLWATLTSIDVWIWLSIPVHVGGHEQTYSLFCTKQLAEFWHGLKKQMSVTTSHLLPVKPGSQKQTYPFPEDTSSNSFIHTAPSIRHQLVSSTLHTVHAT